MTLTTYDSDKLDGLAGRLLDLACEFRRIARRLPQEQFDNILLPDRKAMTWLADFETWTSDALRRFAASRDD